MKQEISPKVVGIVIGIAVLAVAVFIYVRVIKPEAAPVVKPRPWAPSYSGVPAGGGAGATGAPAAPPTSN